jgi:siroheme synthase
VLIQKAREGKVVVRLKGGDPFVLGRGGEEAKALAENAIPFEVVPGVSSAVAVPAYAGIPVTHRGVASSVTIVTGHKASEGSQISPGIK